VADGAGNITIGAEYYDRNEALERNRKFYTRSWSDPNVASNDFFLFGLNGYSTGFFAGPTTQALQAVFSDSPAGTGLCPSGPFGCNFLTGFRFNPDGTLYNPAGNNLNGFGLPIDGRQYAYQNIYDNTFVNSPAGAPPVIQSVKFNNLEALVSAPQTRYSFFASGDYDINDNLNFFARATYAESKTRTRLFGTNASFGWEAQVPYNPLTDSPVDPTLDYGDPATLSAILANPAAYANPGFIAHGAAGAQHPVPLELAVLLNSRSRLAYCLTGAMGCVPGSPNETADPSLVGQFFGYGPGQAGTWIAETYPTDSFPQRATLNVNNVWNLETGLRFDLPVGDWTGELYLARGQSSTYNVAFGNNSLERWRAVVTSPDYGRGQTFFGNEDGASVNFGTVPVPCTSGFYETLFHGDQPASPDC